MGRKNEDELRKSLTVILKRKKKKLRRPPTRWEDAMGEFVRMRECWSMSSDGHTAVGSRFCCCHRPLKEFLRGNTILCIRNTETSILNLRTYQPLNSLG